MNKMQQQVEEFHRTFGHPIGATPQLPTDEMRDLRYRLMLEELDEFAEASFQNDLPEMADAIVDLLYFAFGTASVMGIDIEPLFDAVHAANMDKLDPETKLPVPHPTIAGKIGKRPGWTAPDLAPLIAAQAGDRP